MITETRPDGSTIMYPGPDSLLHVGFVDCPYEELSEKSKYYSRDHFRISDCSLIEYIGVDWARKMPKEKHLPYLIEVFDTLASVCNDAAAYGAFRLVSQALSHTELFLRRARLGGSIHPPFGMMHPFYPSRKLEDVLREELRNELLEFIRARFWMMPIEKPETIPEHRDKYVFALLETRRAMVSECARYWLGTPGDTNDELTFKMLCSMASPSHGACPSSKLPAEAFRSTYDGMKKLRDLAQKELRNAIVEHAEMEQRRRGVEFNWKYWLTVDPRPQECGVVLETLAKTRAVIGGIQGALADIAAHEKVKALAHQVS